MTSKKKNKDVSKEQVEGRSSTPKEDGKTTVEAEDLAFRPKKTQIYNVIIIGDSRSGKTTFLNILKDIDHRPSKVKLTAETKQPEPHNILMEINDLCMTIQVIDTPGFNEISGDGFTRTNVLIASLIKDMVKVNVVNLSMILMFVNARTGLTQSQVNSLEYLINALGHDFCSNLGLMVSNAEEYDKSDEESWLQQFSTVGQLNRLVKSCRLGVFFTGACNSRDDGVFNNYKLMQRIRISRFLSRLLRTTPLILINQETGSQNNLLSMTSSIMDEVVLLKNLSREYNDMTSDLLSRQGQIESDMKKMKNRDKFKTDPIAESLRWIQDIKSRFEELKLNELFGKSESINNALLEIHEPLFASLKAFKDLNTHIKVIAEQQKDLAFDIASTK